MVVAVVVVAVVEEGTKNERKKERKKGGKKKEKKEERTNQRQTLMLNVSMLSYAKTFPVVFTAVIRVFSLNTLKLTGQ